MAESDNTYQPNQMLGGRYRIISVLGRGGMGTVYRVEQVFWEKELALKTINRDCLSDKTTRRFQHEARATFAVDHPNIVSVHDYGLLDDQTPFLAMELVNGKTLAEVLKTRGRLPFAEAVPIFVQVCFGLAHAHKTGVVHRDIKPGNIMLIDDVTPGADGSIKILDFGIARFTQHDDGEMQSLTKTGEIFGSPLYMSPEQCMGAKVDQRSDVYSLGCVLYETLTGTPPFVGEVALSTMMKHQSEDPLSLKAASMGEDFPEGLERIVTKMLAKKPEDRYQNIATVAADFGAFTRGDVESISSLHSPPVADRLPVHEDKITVSKTSLIIQMVVICIISAMASALITNEIKGDKPATAATDPAKLAEILQKLPANIANEKSTKQSIEKIGADVQNLDVLNSRPQSSDDQALDARDLGGLPKIHEHLTGELTLKAAQRLISNPAGEQVRLHDCTITREVLELLSSVSRLNNLDFMNCEISNRDLKLLAKMPNLKRLSVMLSNFDDEGAQAVSDCPVLDTLKADGTKITDKGLSYLIKIKSLRQLKLNRCDVTANGVKPLCRKAAFKKLFLVDCRNIGPKEIYALRIEFPLVNIDDKD